MTDPRDFNHAEELQTEPLSDRKGHLILTGMGLAFILCIVGALVAGRG